MPPEDQPWISENSNSSTKRMSHPFTTPAKLIHSYYRAVQQGIVTYLQLVQMKTSLRFIYGRKRYRTT